LTMNTQQPIYDVDNWYRIGKGRVLQFFATDDEVQEWLLTMLPSEYGPYTLVGADLVRVEKKKYVEKGFEFDITELKQAIYEIEYPRWQYWLRSKVLTPELDFSRQKIITWVLSYTGLVGLHHGGYIKNMGRDASSIGIVDTVSNKSTGEVIKHSEYLKIFNILARQIKKHLCYSSFWKFKNGTEREDFKLQLMTEKAVQAYEAGFQFKNRPGRRLKHRRMPLLSR
jgi:hypothetical protein